jgi:hypothetical protein
MSVEQRRWALLKHLHRLATDFLDVVIGTPADGDVLTYDSGTGTWINAANASGSAIDIQTFTANGTWTKPANAQYSDIYVVAGGAGAGSGRRAAAGTNARGGGGGQGGCVSVGRMLASDLGATETVVVGASAAGGAAVTADTTDGNAGTIGNSSSFGNHVYAQGGQNGTGGSATTNGVGGGAVQSGLNFLGLSGGDASHTGGAGDGLAWQEVASSTGRQNDIRRGPGGGGAGGGLSTADVILSAGNGSSAENSTALANIDATYQGVAGTAGVGPTAGGTYNGTTGFGGGGGGGRPQGSGASATAQAGAAGGVPGGGGGGGSASRNGNNSGAGGAGARGVVVVVTWL